MAAHRENAAIRGRPCLSKNFPFTALLWNLFRFVLFGLYSFSDSSHGKTWAMVLIYNFKKNKTVSDKTDF